MARADDDESPWCRFGISSVCQSDSAIVDGCEVRIDIVEVGPGHTTHLRRLDQRPALRSFHALLGVAGEFQAVGKILAPGILREDQRQRRRLSDASRPVQHGHLVQLRAWLEGAPDDPKEDEVACPGGELKIAFSRLRLELPRIASRLAGACHPTSGESPAIRPWDRPLLSS